MATLQATVPVNDSLSGSTTHAAATPKQAVLPAASGDSVVFYDTISFTHLPIGTKLPLNPESPLVTGVREKTITYTAVNLYGKHVLEPKNSGAAPRFGTSPDWMFPILMLMLAVFTGLRFFYSRYFKQMVTSLFNVNLANQIVRDENILVQRATVYMSIMFYLTAGLFLYLMSEQLHWQLPWAGTGFTRFLKFVFLVSAVYAGKFMVLRFCGWLFGLDRELTTYLFTIFIINNVQGIILFPFITLMCFNPGFGAAWMTTAIISIIGFLYLFRLFRGLQIGLSTHGGSLLYLFLYLCTLELAPLLVVARLTGLG